MFLVLLPADVSGNMISQQDMPLVRRERDTSSRASPSELFSRVGLPPAIRIHPSVHRVVQQILQGHPVRSAPRQQATTGARPLADAQLNLMLDQVLEQRMQRSQFLEFPENQPDHLLHLLVRVQLNLTVSITNVAGRCGRTQRTSASFVEFALVHPVLENVQFRFAHGAFQAEQQTVVVVRRVVDPIHIPDQRLKQGAHLQKMVPIAVGAG